MSIHGLESSTNVDEAKIYAALGSIAECNSSATKLDLMFADCLLDNLRDGVVVVDTNCVIRTWNKASEVMTGIIRQHSLGTQFTPSVLNLSDESGKTICDTASPFEECLKTGKTIKAEYRIVGRSGREVKAEFKIVPVGVQTGKALGAVVFIQDTSVQLDLQRQLKDLYEMSMLDPLTKVANRSEFERVLNQYVRAHHSTDFECSLIICDIDFFKQINDTYGHNVGDQALISFAQLLKQFVRTNDIVARYGGEEFVILCANCDINAAIERAEEIRSTLTKTPQQMLNGKCITASFGVAQLKKVDSPTDFFVKADQALLNAKETGRNKVVSANSNDGSNLQLENAEAKSLAGVKWRKIKGQPIICEEFKSGTPLSVIVESLRGYILEQEAEIRKAEPDYASIKIDTQSSSDPTKKASMVIDVEMQEAVDDDPTLLGQRKNTFLRITLKAAKSGWFKGKNAATELAPQVMNELRRYLMITDESAKLQVTPAATTPGKGR